jgi:hypothetical protein
MRIPAFIGSFLKWLFPNLIEVEQVIQCEWCGREIPTAGADQETIARACEMHDRFFHAKGIATMAASGDGISN